MKNLVERESHYFTLRRVLRYLEMLLDNKLVWMLIVIMKRIFTILITYKTFLDFMIKSWDSIYLSNVNHIQNPTNIVEVRNYVSSQIIH